jgi:hypothetical protein
MGVFGGIVLAVTGVAPNVAIQGKQGLQGGWAIDDQGHVNFVHSVTQQPPLMQQAGAGAVRLNFRLGACFSDWISVGCATADQPRTALGLYDQVLHMAQQHGLKVIGLISNESWHGSQAEWTVNNAENAGGSGDNAYVRDFATNAAGVPGPTLCRQNRDLGNLERAQRLVGESQPRCLQRQQFHLSVELCLAAQALLFGDQDVSSWQFLGSGKRWPLRT